MSFFLQTWKASGQGSNVCKLSTYTRLPGRPCVLRPHRRRGRSRIGTASLKTSRHCGVLFQCAPHAPHVPFGKGRGAASMRIRETVTRFQFSGDARRMRAESRHVTPSLERVTAQRVALSDASPFAYRVPSLVLRCPTLPPHHESRAYAQISQVGYRVISPWPQCSVESRRAAHPTLSHLLAPAGGKNGKPSPNSLPGLREGLRYPEV
jgi:hypothetical protein